MKIIVTGAAGFIGSYLTARLLQEGHEVVGIDNMSYGDPVNIAAIREEARFTFVQGDVCERKVFSGLSADVVVHLASQKIPRYDNALRTLEENHAMLDNVLEKCVCDGSKLVYASTSDVYGKNTSLPFREDSDLVMGPTTVKRWSYALSKMYGEQYIIANHDAHGIVYTIVRFFGSYGPNQNTTWWGGPQSVFIGKALEKEPIEIHGHGRQTRTFTYIDDTVEALTHCVLDSRADNEIFNIGSATEGEISINDLARMIWHLVNGKTSEPRLSYIPYETFGRYEDVQRRLPDISKITGMFGFKPKIALEEGLKRTIEWQKRRISQ